MSPRIKPITCRVIASLVIATFLPLPLRADPLNPNNFSSLGSINSGGINVNTSTLELKLGGNLPVFGTGVAHSQGAGNPEVAVFTFDNINISGITIHGTRPFALLSKGNLTFNGFVNGSIDGNVFSNGFAPGSLGGGVGGTPAGGAGGGPGGGAAISGFGYGDGGAFGGNGGLGFTHKNSVSPAAAYGDITSVLQGGSGGSAGPTNNGGGGRGGAAVEFGAVGSVSLGSIDVNGSQNPSNVNVAGPGGGSGGGIIVHGQTVTLNGTLSAKGANGRPLAGGGGGGRIAVLGWDTNYTLGTVPNGIVADGGTVISASTRGKAGVITIEPTTTTIPNGTSVTLAGSRIVSVSGQTGNTNERIELDITRNVTVQTGGTATFGASDVLTNTADINVQGAGVFDLAGFNQTIDSLSGDGSLKLGSGTLTVGNDNSSSTFSGVISNVDNGNLVKNGAGTLTLSGANTYTGTTTVNAGTLEVTGSLASSSVSVASGATLTGSGTASIPITVNGTLSGTGTYGNVTLNPGSTLSPGNSPDTINAGDTVFSGAGNYNWQVFDANGAAGVGYDLLNITGTLTTTAASGFNINLWSLSGISPDVNGDAINFDNTQAFTFTLAQTTGGVVGFNAANFNIVTTANNGTGGFTNTLGAGTFNLGLASGGNNLVLNFSPGTAIPEPSSLVLLSLGVAGIVGCSRRRRRQTGGTSDSS